MPNQPDPNTVSTSFTLPRQLLKEVERRAKSEMIPKAAFIRRALMNFLSAKERAAVEAAMNPPPPQSKAPRPRRKAAAKEKRAQLRDIHAVSVSIFGSIPAGWPQSFDQESNRYTVREVRVRKGRFPEGAFGLDVRGDSMNTAKGKFGPILDGEVVVLLPPDLREPKHGDIVAALCDGQTTLKRLDCKRGPHCVLRAESSNPAFASDITPAHDLTIQGVVVGKL